MKKRDTEEQTIAILGEAEAQDSGQDAVQAPQHQRTDVFPPA